MHKLFALLLFVFPFISEGQVLPKPSGKYQPGVRSFFLTDFTRTDSALQQHRLIPVRVWYPASTKGGHLEDYVPMGLKSALQKIRYSNQDSLTLKSLTTLNSHSIPDAGPVKGNSKFPVVLFSPGWGMSSFSYTALVEDLVSQGMIVIAMDNLYCGPVRLPDGRLITQKDYPYNQYTPYIQAAAQDARFVMNSLLTGVKEFGFLNSLFDRTRLGVMGHSIGGNIALLVAQDPEPFRFAINLDGGAFEKALIGTMKIPALTVRSFPKYTDAELSARGRTRKGWDDMGAKIDSSFMENLARTQAPSIEVKIPATGHMSFSDAPFVMPEMLTRFGGTYLTPQETLRTTTDLITSFIRSQDAASLQAFTNRVKKQGKGVRVFGIQKD